MSKHESYRKTRWNKNKNQKFSDSKFNCLCKDKCVSGYKGARKNHCRTFDSCKCMPYDIPNYDESCKIHGANKPIVDCWKLNSKNDDCSEQICWGDVVFVLEQHVHEDGDYLYFHACQGHIKYTFTCAPEDYILCPDK